MPKTIFVVEDDPTLRAILRRVITSSWGFDVREFSDGEKALGNLGEHVDVILLDLLLPDLGGLEFLRRAKEQMPDLPVIILSAQDDVALAVEALRKGATDYFSKPPDFPKLEASVRNAVQSHDLSREVRRLRELLATKSLHDSIITVDRSMHDVLVLIEKVKDIDIDVLIQGESGTGKELVARAIHAEGKRSNGPFVIVNCASIPRDLLESELFGHERGAFTGAVQRRIGKFEQANGGTIFLDEIAELDLTLQAKVLRVIQTKEFDRVGGHELLKSDVRIISATNKNLQEYVSRQLFREDLYFRLSSFPIFLPPLRKRTGDIPLLVEHFLGHAGARTPGRAFRMSPKALDLMTRYPWPGNVRELGHVIERACILAETDEITPQELPMNLRMEAPQENGTAVPAGEMRIQTLEEAKAEAVRAALRGSDGNLVDAARRLGIGRATLYRLIRKYSITA